MTDEQYDAITKSLHDNNIYVEGDCFKTRDAITGRKVAADRNRLQAFFDVHHVTPTDYIEEIRLRTDRAYADAMADAPANATNNYSEMKFLHPGIAKMSPWSEADRQVFSRFGFATNPSDGTLVLIIDRGDGTWAVVPFGRNAMFAAADIASKCSSARPTDTKFRNLYEEMTLGFKARIDRAIEAWVEGENDNGDTFVRALGMNIPHCMLKRLSLSLIVEKVKYDVQTPNGVERVSVKVARCGKFVPPGKSDEVNPLDFIARYPCDLVSHDEMKRPMPKVFSNDPSEPAMCYIDLETICEEGPCPTWDKYMSRYTEGEALVMEAYIFSILDAGNGGRQLLYIYDPMGFSAKSAMINCIIECLGENMCISIQKDSLNNQFSLAKVWDKRLVTYADNKNPKLLMSEKLHMMTGHDYADIEMKGRNSFHAKLQTKLIVSGNTPLEIHPDARHEVTRAIIVRPNMTDDMLKEFCAVNQDGTLKRRPNGEPIFLGDPSFEKNLKKEFRRFLTRCRAAYEKLCPTRSDIQLPDTMYDELMSFAPTETYTMADFFDTYFEVQEGAMVSVREFRNKFTNSRMLYADTGRDAPITYSDFTEYVMKKYPSVRFGVLRYKDGARCRVVEGIRFRETKA